MKRYEDMKAAFAMSPFRSRFHLSERDKRTLAMHNRSVMEAQCRKIIETRLAPAVIPNDGKQTPMRGCPVFIAQHATACCCRNCLARWHHIPRGRALSEAEISGIVALLMDFMYADAGDLSGYAVTGELFS